MKLTFNDIKQIVKESVNNIIKEDVFGLNGSSFEKLGMKNPKSDYMYDKQEVQQKCYELAKYLDSFSEYINGVEEDVENGVEEKKGVISNVRMHHWWNNSDDDINYYDEKYLLESLEKISSMVSKLKSELNDVIES